MLIIFTNAVGVRGRAIMERWHWLLAMLAIMALVGVGYRVWWLAGPPIVRMPIEEVEPPRTVAAAEWKSPYCGFWDDGCTECVRETPAAPAHCKLAPESPPGECKRRTIMCFRPMAQHIFEKMCERFQYVDIRISSDGLIHGINDVEWPFWVLGPLGWTVKNEHNFLLRRAGDTAVMLGSHGWLVYKQREALRIFQGDSNLAWRDAKPISDVKRQDFYCVSPYR